MRVAPTSLCLLLALALAAAAATDESLFAGAATTSTAPPAGLAVTRRARVRGASPPTDPLGGLLGHATAGGELASLLTASGRAEEEEGAEEGGGGQGARARPRGVNAAAPPPRVEAATPATLIGDLPPAPTVSADDEALTVSADEDAPTATMTAPLETPEPGVHAEEVFEAPADAVPLAPDLPANDPPPASDLLPAVNAAADAAPDVDAVTSEAVARLSAVGVIAPDLLARFTAALASSGEGEEEEGERGGTGGGALSRLASLFSGGGNAGGPSSLLGSLLGGGGGGGEGEDAPLFDSDLKDTTTTATTTTATATAPAAPTPSPPTGGESALALHNAARARHADTPPLTWSPAIAAAAAKHAARCVFAHSNSPNGENIAMGQRSWGEVVGAWYGEGPRGGHRSQVIWAGSTGLGCGAAACGKGVGGGGTLYVCQYSPAGNVAGQARANVKPLKEG